MSGKAIEPDSVPLPAGERVTSEARCFNSGAESPSPQPSPLRGEGAQALCPAAAPPRRRADLDALRIVLCGGIVLFHALSIYSAEPIYHLKSALPSPAASVLAELLRIAIDPLFFVLAGWSAVVSLRRRGAGDFVRERARRLLVPLVAGTVLLGPFIKYVELRHGRDIGFHGLWLVPPLQDGFVAFVPRYFTRMNLLTWSHLWFLAYLFLVSLLLLPLTLHLARSKPRAEVPAAAVVYLPALAFAALLAGFDGYWPFLPNLLTDWTNFAWFALCFAIGAGLAAWPGFATRLHGEAWRMLVLMLAAYAGVVVLGQSIAGRACVGLTAWGAIGAGLGLARRLAPTPSFTALSEAALPVYILHLVPVLALGLVVVPLELPVWIAAAVIWLGATIVTLAAVRWLIRPWRAMRWLVGLNALPAKPPAGGV
jgi:peptidoglycan/LPS O-acetylase OafA/YrhL